MGGAGMFSNFLNIIAFVSFFGFRMMNAPKPVTFGDSTTSHVALFLLCIVGAVVGGWVPIALVIAPLASARMVVLWLQENNKLPAWLRWCISDEESGVRTAGLTTPSVDRESNRAETEWVGE